jgi:hypothetical protein
MVRPNFPFSDFIGMSHTNRYIRWQRYTRLQREVTSAKTKLSGHSLAVRSAASVASKGMPSRLRFYFEDHGPEDYSLAQP